VAGQAIHALARGDDSLHARVGALLVAEFFEIIRLTLTKSK